MVLLVEEGGVNDLDFYLFIYLFIAVDGRLWVAGGDGVRCV